MRLVAGLCPDPLGSLQHSPGPLDGLNGKKRKGSVEGERAGASRGTPGDTKCITEILKGTKIRKLGNKV